MRIGLLSDFVELSSSIIGRDSRLTLPRATCRAMTAYRRGFEEVQRRVLAGWRPCDQRAKELNKPRLRDVRRLRLMGMQPIGVPELQVRDRQRAAEQETLNLIRVSRFEVLPLRFG